MTLRPLVVLLPEDVRYTGLSSDQLRAVSPHLFSWIGMVFRSWGAFDIGFGILIIGLVRNAYRNGEHWTWWTLVAAGATTFTGFLIVNVLLGSDFKWVIAILYVSYDTALWLGKPSDQTM